MARPGSKERSPKAMAAATKVIDDAQPRAAKVLLEALQAVTHYPRIIGRDEKGKPEYEYVEVPDHQVRIKAAVALLNKRIPDVTKTELSGSVTFTPLRIEA